MTSTGAPVAGTIADRLPGVSPSRLSSTARAALLVSLLLVGVADLTVLDAMVLPRYLAARARPGLVMPAREERPTAPVPIPAPSPPIPPSLPAPPAPAMAEMPAAETPPTEVLEQLPPLLFWRNASVLTKDAQRTLARLLRS